MIPEGSDAISPAPHHDIYSIEDLRQLVFSLKEATEYKKPIIVKVAAVHNIAAIASGIARSGADIIAIDGFRGGTGAAPTRIRDNVGIRLSLRLPPLTSGCATREYADNVSCGGRKHTLGLRRGQRQLRSEPTHAISPPRLCLPSGLPPLPHLPDRPMQLGNRDPAPRACKTAQSQHRI